MAYNSYRGARTAHGYGTPELRGANHAVDDWHGNHAVDDWQTRIGGGHSSPRAVDDSGLPSWGRPAQRINPFRGQY